MALDQTQISNIIIAIRPYIYSLRYYEAFEELLGNSISKFCYINVCLCYEKADWAAKNAFTSQRGNRFEIFVSKFKMAVDLQIVGEVYAI